MMTDKKTFGMQDRKVVLSTLWIFLTANYIYCDVLAHMQPATIKEIITGTIGSIQITQGFLLTAAIMMEIPFAMILLARVLKYRVNRWVNIIAGELRQPRITFFIAQSRLPVRCSSPGTRGSGVTLKVSPAEAPDIPNKRPVQIVQKRR
jgi:hypothetical protein